MTALKKDVPVGSSPAPTQQHGSWLSPLSDLQREINSVFGRFFDRDLMPLDRDLFPRWGVPARLKSFSLIPKVEVSEQKDKYEITAELPGVEEKDVSVTVHDGVLFLKGEKKSEEAREEKNVHISERSYGSFERSFVLPDDADEESIEARKTDGVLKVTIAKTEKPKTSARKIDVKKA